MSRLSGRVAIVTGAAMGLGAAYARGLAREGAKVCLCDVDDASPVAESIRAAGGEAIATKTDVSSGPSVAAMIEATLKAFGGLHILVNNAAISAKITNRPFYEIPSDEWDRVMAVNARGTFECAKAVTPTMRAQKYGKIVNITSTTVFKGVTGVMQYTASKGAIIAMTRVMARELGGDNICVNCIAPGLTPTESVMSNPANVAMVGHAAEARAIKRAQTPEDLVGAVVFFSSAESDFITGQTLPVDGGVVLDSTSASAVTVITGGAGHVGSACARRFGDRQLLLCDAEPVALGRAATLLQAEGSHATTFVCDITDRAQTDALAAHAATIGPLATIVHCAGVAPPTPAATIYAVNIVGTANLLDAFEPFVTSGSVAVCIASIAGYRRFAHTFDAHLRASDTSGLLRAVDAVKDIDPSRLAYAVSKRYVILQCRVRVPAWGARGGRLVSVSPGSLEDTQMGATRMSVAVHEVAEPVGRRPRIEDVVNAVEFGASPQAAMLSGADLLVDGGFLAAVNHKLPVDERESWHAIRT